jgi:hypothetical protein
MIPSSPLFLDSWVDFNCQHWGVRPLRLRYSPQDAELPLLNAILYTDRYGRLILPPRNPYVALSFQPTPAQKGYRIQRQWRQMAALLANEMRRYKFTGFDLLLPPEAVDVRPWQWLGYRAAVRYTYYINFPFDLGEAEQVVRKQVKKALNYGCTCERSNDVRPIAVCLEETESRQGFHLSRFSPEELEAGLDVVGEEHYRAYVCRAANGEVASSLVTLHAPGARAIALFFGTKTEYLNTGVARLLIQHSFTDLEAVGATGFDFGGVSSPQIARAKEALGGQLMPYYGLEDYNARQFLRWTMNYLRHMGRRQVG